MGYTHYWNRRQNLDKQTFGILIHLAHDVITAAEEKGLALNADLNDAHITLNGSGEESHETFHFPRVMTLHDWQRPNENDLYFDFCKTARKPYDVVVVALLILIVSLWNDKYRNHVTVHSDGMVSDWQEGYDLLMEAMNDREDVDIMRPEDFLEPEHTESA